MRWTRDPRSSNIERSGPFAILRSEATVRTYSQARGMTPRLVVRWELWHDGRFLRECSKRRIARREAECIAQGGVR